jgi:uncharacterized membrane protein YoaK (UPF0700 family)
MADEAEPSKMASTSAVLLCLAAGVTDILSYMTLGSIFTSAMTGCAALFFIKMSAAQYPAAVRAALAIGSYMVGCAVAAALQPRDEALVKTPFTLRRLLLAECVLLGLYVIVAVRAGAPAKGASELLLIFISATAMGVQSIVARDLAEPGISTVVLNPTMTSLGVALTKWLMGRERRLPRPNRLQAVVIATYAGGAAITAAALALHIFDTVMLPFLIVFAVLVLTSVECRSSGTHH